MGQIEICSVSENVNVELCTVLSSVSVHPAITNTIKSKEVEGVMQYFHPPMLLSHLH